MYYTTYSSGVFSFHMVLFEMHYGQERKVQMSGMIYVLIKSVLGSSI